MTFRSRFRFSAWIALSLLVAFACGKDSPTKSSQTPSRITLSVQSATLTAIGQTLQISATVLDRDSRVISNADVTWKSSNASVVRVGTDGLVTAVTNGSAQITAITGVVSATANMIVAQEAGRISIAPDSATLSAIGETVQLTATVYDSADQPIAGASVIWASSDPAVATVSAGGLVTAEASGAATITATSGSASGTASVTVTLPPEPPPPEPPPPEPPPPAARIVITPASATLTAEGNTVRLTATVYDGSDGIIVDAAVSWSSGDPTVATVSTSGLVTAVGNGTAEMTASTGGVSANTTISVILPRIPARIVVAPLTTTLTAEGGTVRFNATVYDEGDDIIADAAVSWTSSNPSVATVSAFGLVTAVDNGTTTVTASAEDLSARATVTVILPRMPARITITPLTNTIMAVGDTLRLTAAVHDADGAPIADATVTWVSTQPNVATVSTSGLVTAVGNGTTTVIATAGSVSTSALITVDVPDPVDVERQALVAIYHGLDGPGWSTATNWLTDAPLGEWHGVHTDADGLVVRLVLAGNGLAGTIPREIGDLGDLTELALNQNLLSGAIPPEIGQLRNLTKLFLGNNLLTGTIPQEIGNLERVFNLSLRINRLEGSIPPEIGQLRRLIFVSLDDNRLTGVIPPEIGNLRFLEYLALHRNTITGPIPPGFGRLESLRTLQLQSNRLTGSIPPEFGMLTRLLRLSLAGNPDMAGTLPGELTALPLESLDLHSTRLCPPDDAAFQAWLNGIASVTLPNCGIQESLNEPM